MLHAVSLDKNLVSRLNSPTVFFVPDGDLHYYLGLRNEVEGNLRAALLDYESFITTTRGTRYLDRARAHVDELHRLGVREHEELRLDQIRPLP
jgi:hypothetical protein